MRSSALIAAAVAALTVAHAGAAAAQSAGPDEPPAPPPADDFDDLDVGPVDDAGPAAPAPVDAAPAGDPPPRPDVVPDASSARSGDGPAFVLAVELGVGGAMSGGSDAYGAGVGRGFMIGVRWRRASIEWHLRQQYDAPVDGALVAANTAGHVGMSSLGVRVETGAALSVYGGLAKASVPLLVLDADAVVRADELHGMGPIAGVELGRTWGTTRVGVELRLAKLVVTDAMPAQLTVTGPADGTGTIPVMVDRTSLQPLLATLTVAVRFSTN